MLTLLQPIIVRLGVIHISYEHLLSMLLFGGVRSWLRNKNDERVQQVFIGILRRYVIRNNNALIWVPPQYLLILYNMPLG